MKWLLFPPLADSMERSSGRAHLLGNLKDEVFEGYMKCPAGGLSSTQGPLLGNLEGV
jgi:hypothetical protein